MEWTHRKATLALSILTMLGAPPVWAVLGGQESSVSLDLQVLHGTDREEAHQGYKFHQITVPDGTVVKEFVSPAGLVFGISWQAPHMPNLQERPVCLKGQLGVIKQFHSGEGTVNGNGRRNRL